MAVVVQYYPWNSLVFFSLLCITQQKQRIMIPNYTKSAIEPQHTWSHYTKITSWVTVLPRATFHVSNGNNIVASNFACFAANDVKGRQVVKSATSKPTFELSFCEHTLWQYFSCISAPSAAPLNVNGVPTSADSILVTWQVRTFGFNRY